MRLTGRRQAAKARRIRREGYACNRRDSPKERRPARIFTVYDHRVRLRKKNRGLPLFGKNGTLFQKIGEWLAIPAPPGEGGENPRMGGKDRGGEEKNDLLSHHKKYLIFRTSNVLNWKKEKWVRRHRLRKKGGYAFREKNSRIRKKREGHGEGNSWERRYSHVPRTSKKQVFVKRYKVRAFSLRGGFFKATHEGGRV